MTTLSRPLARWRLPSGRLRLAVADALLAAGTVAVEVVFTATLAPGQQSESLGNLGRDLADVANGNGLTGAQLGLVAVYSVAAAAPIVLRRVALWPAIVLAVCGLAIPLLADRAPLSQVVAYVLLTYTAAANLVLRRAVLAAAVLWLPVLAAEAVLVPRHGAPLGIGPAVAGAINVLIALVCFFIGRTVCARRAYTQALEERARTAEANQRSLAEQAVADERRRIARELHDVVAHHVSVMGVLATGARRVLPKDPGATDEALGTIEDTSRTTLREMRRLLDVLRTDAEPADLTPQPGLAGIEALVEQVREAGLPVTLTVDGVPSTLDPGVALTIFRIVQEALTNALKHAGEATAQVRLAFGVYWLIVEIFDTGRGPAPQSGHVGHGLVGMRERVALYGGTLRTGPRPGGGYRVYAKIPMEQLGAPTEGR